MSKYFTFAVKIIYSWKKVPLGFVCPIKNKVIWDKNLNRKVRQEYAENAKIYLNKNIANLAVKNKTYMAKKGSLLVIDDNKSILTAIELLVRPIFNQVTLLSNPNQIISLLKTKEFDVVVLDMNFNAGINTGNEGVYWLKRIKDIAQDVSVVMITAYGNVELAVKSLKQGATDFVLKPWDNEKFLATLQSALELSISKKKVQDLTKKQQNLKEAFNKEHKSIIGESEPIRQVMNLVKKVAKTDANVLITGENGTGKELFAREIHKLSKRSKEILVNVDMGAISESLFESELFGHEKGAFTDAKTSRAGKFETANHGSLFLDEIGNLSYHLQAKLLAALQNREIFRIGSTTPIPIDIRLISATNKDIMDLVQKALFREDLLYRINTIHIEIPPLRERGSDIMLLVDFFLDKYVKKYDKQGLSINLPARDKLMNYNWPGNIRELQHTIEKAVILSDGSVLKPENFFIHPIEQYANRDKTQLTLEEAEKRMIMQSLEQNDGNISLAAEKLGITRQTLYNKMNKYKL